MLIDGFCAIFVVFNLSPVYVDAVYPAGDSDLLNKHKLVFSLVFDF